MPIDIKQVPVHKSKNGVWMASNDPTQPEFVSASRAVAVHAMRALGADEHDVHKRDRVIYAIYGIVEGMLDYVSENSNHIETKEITRLRNRVNELESHLALSIEMRTN